LIISRSVLLRIENVSDKLSEKVETYFIFNNLFSENRAMYEIMWKNYGRGRQVTDENYNKAHALSILDN